MIPQAVLNAFYPVARVAGLTGTVQTRLLGQNLTLTPPRLFVVKSKKKLATPSIHYALSASFI